MIFAAFAASLLAAPDLSTASARAALAEPGVVLAAEVRAARFVAVNATGAAALAVFGSREGHWAHALVPAHGALEVRLPHGALDGYWVEFASEGPFGLRRSGALELRAFAGSADDVVWIAGDERELGAWSQRADALAPIEPLAGGTTPLERAGAIELRGTVTAPLVHVPGVKPEKSDAGDAPPDVGDSPLPPF